MPARQPQQRCGHQGEGRLPLAGCRNLCGNGFCAQPICPVRTGSSICAICAGCPIKSGRTVHPIHPVHARSTVSPIRASRSSDET